MPQSVPQRSFSSRQRRALFGREWDLTLLRRAFRQAADGSGGLVLISGAAGIGKTSLTQALAQDAESESAIVLTAACYDLTVTPPYRPWLDLLSGIDGDESPSSLINFSVDDGDVRPRSQDALLGQVFEILENAASQQPVVVIIEDIHWADTASLDLLRYVTRQLPGLPLLVVATYRDTELGRDNPLRQLLPVLTRESQATRLNLRPLVRDDVRSLVQDHYELSPADELIVTAYLQDRAEGNPLFISEILKTLEEARAIRMKSGRWEVGNLGHVPTPSLVRQVIEGHLTRLDDVSRDLLAVAAVIGQDVPLNVWQEATGATDEDISVAIRLAKDSDLLEEVAATASLRFTHALVREALYYELELPQRRRWHTVVGEILAGQPFADPDTVAYHFREARHQDAARWLMAAGERAQQLYAWRTAAERFESVLPLLGPDKLAMEMRGWLHYRIGLLLIYADPAKGIACLRQAERVAHDIGDKQLAALAMSDRGLLRCLVGDVRRGLSEMADGVDRLEALPAVERDNGAGELQDLETLLTIESMKRGALDLAGIAAGAHSRRGALVFWLAWTGRYDEVIAMGESYVNQSSHSLDEMQDSLGDALAGLGHAYAALGRPEDALQAFKDARDAYQRIDHHFKVGNTAIYELSQAFLPYRADRVMEREWLAEEAEAG
jgi:predicted ATPase